MKKTSGLAFIISLVLLVMVTSCKKDDHTPQIRIDNLTGFAQKGPYINGSSVIVYDLNPDLTPTGKSYNVQIIDNCGAFLLNNITLSSNYVSLRADGFYFNEISGQQSIAPITLYAIADISDIRDININILTHLEKARVEYLVQNGRSFKEAKNQALKEVLAIFNIEKSDIKTSENLNISVSGEDNGILVAISSIIYCNRIRQIM